MKQEIPLIAQHASWLSLDPVVGCPAECAYCYLHPLDLTKKKPEKYVSPKELYNLLLLHPHFQKDVFGKSKKTFPICIGNYTDMCGTPENKSYLLELLKMHKSTIPETPVCIVTKGKLDEHFLSFVNSLQLKVIFFISLSFMSQEFERGTTPFKERLNNFKRISKYEYINAIHYWRPITPINTPNSEIAEEQLQSLIDAGATASILHGLKFGDDLQNYWEEETTNPLHDYFVQKKIELPDLKHSITDNLMQDIIISLGRKKQYPIFLNPTCALGFVLNQPDYNSTFRGHLRGKLCLPAHCPSKQRELCSIFEGLNKTPSIEVINLVASYLNIDTQNIKYKQENDVIVVDTRLTDAEERFLRHATGFLVQANQTVQTLEWSISVSKASQSSRSKTWQKE